MATTEREREVREPGFTEPESQEADTLTHLEERIQKTVILVTRLRHEKDAALKELAETQASLSTVQAALEDSQAGSAGISKELSALRAEKQQVRNRLEKLLGHIDQLGAV
jgi:FtsZ-binding cell division protein ZapB